MPPADLPARVALAGGTQFEVILETPLSTRISKKGQAVTFRTANAVPVEGGLEIPPDTAFHGTILTAKKPGGFGRGGEIRVDVAEVEVLAGQRSPVSARLESADLDSTGRARSDSNKTANVLDLAQWTLMGTLIGGQVQGKKGAGYGAGAGALAALIILMSRRGSDIYIEPGTPFRVILDEPVEFDGLQLWNAQEAYAQAHSPGDTGAASAESPVLPEGERPQLKRRPKRIP
jgi:hypothetical protein